MATAEMTPDAAPVTASREDFVQRLRDETAAVALRRKVFTNTLALDTAERQRVAELYDCDWRSIRSRKVLVDRKHAKVARCYSLVEAAIKYWNSVTTPWPGERGKRLIKRHRIESFEATMRNILDDLGDAMAELDGVWRTEVMDEARKRLVRLFDAGDYPASPIGEWGFDWEFPNVEPPEFLKQLNPELYEAESNRIRARFSEALTAAEDAIANEFGAMIAKLAERLQPDAEGNVKTFHASSVEKLQEFFARFADLTVGSNADLDALVSQAQGLLEGRTPTELRKDATVRQQIAEGLSGIYERVAEYMVDRPDRQIDLEYDE